MKYINPKYTSIEFFSLLNKAKIRYTVLRWFNSFETLSKQKDIDILVDDEDAYLVKDLLVQENENGIQRIDVYGVSDRSFPGYNKLPYYPPHLAETILDNRVFKDGLYYVPKSDIYLLSFIFHIIFHKAEASGIAINNRAKTNSRQSNKYLLEIKRAALEASITIPSIPTLENLYGFLGQFCWLPPVEWTRKIAHNRSPWLISLYAAKSNTRSKAVFIVRDKAKAPAIHSNLVRLFSKEKFNLLGYCVLDNNQADRAKKILRNGVWDRGPYKLNGGDPYSCYIVDDPQPEPVQEEIRTKHPFLQNQRVLKFKTKARTIIQDCLQERSINCIHSTDDNLEVEEYLSVLFGQSETQKSPTSFCESKFKLLSNIKTTGKRSSVRLVKYLDKLAILKSFHFENEVFFEREISAYHALSGKGSFVPKLYTATKNQLLIEHIDFDSSVQIEFLKKNLDQVASIVHYLWSQGFAHLDLHPDNFLIAKSGRMYLIDFEFFYKYKQRPGSVFESYDLTGFPDSTSWGIKGKDPIGFINDHWKKLCGLRLDQIVKEYLNW